jgi:hypothetical protein
MLERQKPSLVRAAQGAVTAETAGGDDAVAGNEDGETILRAERASGAGRSGTAGKCGELAVGDYLAARDGTQDARELGAERCELAQVDVDIREVLVAAGEVAAESLDESWREIVTAACAFGG